jgi:iron complex outermembrane receptor protein
MKILSLPAAIAAAFAFTASAAETAAPRVFILGEIGAAALPDAPGQAGDSIDAGDIRRHDRVSAGEAVDLLPGVSLSKQGQRNELMVWVRGFNLRQVPVYVDGIPVYVPYDGYADMGRFTTFDLARIDVAKGYSSALYGANTLGGAINLVSRRPALPFEGDAGAGLAWDRGGARNGESAYLNAGSNQGSWYVQGSLSYTTQDYYRLGRGFVPARGEDGGRRDNSLSRDGKASLKVGLTPNATDEYALNLISQKGRKDDPPYAGSAAGVNPAYWQWPYWDKRSAYFLSDTHFGAHALKLRAYRDEFTNSLLAWDDGTYSTMKKASSFRSMYDDYTNGFSVQGDFRVSAANALSASYTWKHDVHREANAGEPVRRQADRTQTVALEDSHLFGERLSLLAGVSFERRESLAAQDYNAATGAVTDFARADNRRVNGQAALHYRLDGGGTVHVSAARKSRFPTLKDRYSYRMGRGLPNPALAEETANHVEIGYRGRLHGNAVEATLFHSAITNLIQSNTLVTLCNGSRCLQNQNVGKSTAEGVELALRRRAGMWDFDGNYTYLHRSQDSNPGLVLTDTPRHKGFVSALARLGGGWEAVGSVRAYSRRHSSSDGLQVAGGFAVTDAKAVYRFGNGARVEAGTRNAFDKLYAYAEGYPEAGRTWFVQAGRQW